MRFVAVLTVALALGSWAALAATDEDLWKLHMRRAMEAHKAGDLAAAAERLESALALAEEFDTEGERLAETLLAVAAVRFDRQDYAGALAPLERAVPLIERTAGPDSTKLAGALNALGLVHGLERRPDEAETLYLRALAIYERALGPEHPRVGAVRENLADLALATGRYEDAAAGFRRALAIKERAYGRESPELIDTLRSYALALTYLGREDEAAGLDARATAIAERTGGSNNDP